MGKYKHPEIFDELELQIILSKTCVAHKRFLKPDCEGLLPGQPLWYLTDPV